MHFIRCTGASAHSCLRTYNVQGEWSLRGTWISDITYIWNLFWEVALQCNVYLSINLIFILDFSEGDIYVVPFNNSIVFQFSGKNFPRPGQMNINVATWGRLMKRALPIPTPCSDNSGVLSPQGSIASPGIVALCCCRNG